jgi:DNA-directed RNA polymerase specialized sigma24 family protein
VAILLRRPDITLDDRGLSWLATVAIREAWQHAASARETPAGGFAFSGGGELAEPAHPDDRSAEQRALTHIEHDERVRAFATLKPREREALILKGLGYSYQEIAKLTQSSYTAVISSRRCRCRAQAVMCVRRHVVERGGASVVVRQ